MPRYCLVVSDGLGFSIAVLSRVAGIGKNGENDWGVHSSPILLEVEFRILGSFLLVFLFWQHNSVNPVDHCQSVMLN